MISESRTAAVSEGTVHEASRTVPIADFPGVVVLGAGLAGVVAAVNAARMGVKTLLVDSRMYPGGAAADEVFFPRPGESSSGAAGEIISRIEQEESGGRKEISVGKLLSGDALKRTCQLLIEEAGVLTRFSSLISSFTLEDRRIHRIITEGPGGRTAYICRALIDASENGEAAERSGVPVSVFRLSDRAVRLRLTLGGVESASVHLDKKIISRFLSKGVRFTRGGRVRLLSSPFSGVAVCELILPDTFESMQEDFSSRTFSRYRMYVSRAMDFLREWIPGYETARIMSMAEVGSPGLVHSVTGEYLLTLNDIRSGKIFEDWAAVGRLSGEGTEYTVPYRSFRSPAVENLLFCGRNLSGTSDTARILRSFQSCVYSGQTAGIAAALCARRNCSTASLPVSDLQIVLKSQGIHP